MMNDIGNAAKRDVLATPHALEMLLQIADRGSTHGALWELFGGEVYYATKDVLQFHGLLHVRDLDVLISPRGAEIVRQLRSEAGSSPGVE